MSEPSIFTEFTKPNTNVILPAITEEYQKMKGKSSRISSSAMFLIETSVRIFTENNLGKKSLGVDAKVNALHKLYQQTGLRFKSNPEIIDLTIGADCNLTCSYCCKEYSTAWRRDVVINGDYANDVRYQATNKDRLLLKISQPELKYSTHYQALLKEIELAAPALKTLVITGGEPLLDNFLFDTLANLKMSDQSVIEIYTGLGVGSSRFANIVQKLKQIPNLQIIVSAENTEKFAEFNRYGIQWQEFMNKINLLKQNNIKIKFHATLTNLTIFGFVQFYKQFKDEEIKLTFAYQPDMMAVYVLDYHSKQQLMQDLTLLPEHFSTPLSKSITPDPSEIQRNNIGNFLKEFVNRRKDLNLNIFPNKFLTWAGLSHVV